MHGRCGISASGLVLGDRVPSPRESSAPSASAAVQESLGQLSFLPGSTSVSSVEGTASSTSNPVVAPDFTPSSGTSSDGRSALTLRAAGWGCSATVTRPRSVAVTAIRAETPVEVQAAEVSSNLLTLSAAASTSLVIARRRNKLNEGGKSLGGRSIRGSRPRPP